MRVGFRLWRPWDPSRYPNRDIEFFAPRFLFVELFKHKDRLMQVSRLPEENVLEALNAMLESVCLIDAASVSLGIWMEARRLCDGVDLKDTAFVAMTLHLGAELWTEDNALKSGLRAKGFD